jgi:predicted AAA+ superfamily ATPase
MHELGKATLIISGSNAKLLSRELGTVLTGRHLDIVVYLLSFREFLEFKGLKLFSDSKDISIIRGYLREYLARGSFPALTFLQSGLKEWFLAYYDDVLEKDLIRRFRIRKIEELKALLNFYMSNISKLSTFNSVAKFLKISPDTAEKFTAYFEQSYLLFSMKRFSFGFKEQRRSSRKIYSIDTVLAGPMGFRMSDDLGRVAENIVYLEYLRRKVFNPEYEFFYWKEEQSGRDGKEIDFVIKSGNRIVEIVQVCMGNLAEDTKKRELRAVAKAVKKLNPDKIIVITGEYEGIEKYEYGNVIFIPLWKWLLDV